MNPDDYDDLESLPIEQQAYDYEPTLRQPQPPPEPAPREDDSQEREPVLYRGTGSDPTFGYLLAMALSVGLLPLVPYNAAGEAAAPMNAFASACKERGLVSRNLVDSYLLAPPLVTKPEQIDQIVEIVRDSAREVIAWARRQKPEL